MSKDGKDLVELLKVRYEIRTEEEGLKQSRWYEELDDLTSLEYLITDGDRLSDGTELLVLKLGEEYDEISPDRNPMSFTVEFRFLDGSRRWLQFFGHYVSHDGGRWDGYGEVTKKEKTVTVFE